MKKIIPAIICFILVVWSAGSCTRQQNQNKVATELSGNKNDTRSGQVDETTSNVNNLYNDSCFVEKRFFETVYPQCPPDIQPEMYDLMLVTFDAQNIYVDIEHYWRSLEWIEIAKSDNNNAVEQQKLSRSYLKDLNRYAKAYKASQISSRNMKSISIQNIKESMKLANTPSEKMTDTYNAGTVIDKIERRYRSTAAYKSLGFSNANTGVYMDDFHNSLNNPNDLILKTIIKSKDSEYKGTSIVELQKIMDSGKYSKWLPMVWWRWRYLAGMYFGSPSKDGAIANWFYNEAKIKCYNTIFAI